MNAEKTGKLIKKARTEKGLSQKNLADALNMSTTAISKWENGHSLPDIALLENLSSVLGLSITEIVIGERNNTMDIKENETAIKSVINTALSQKKKSVIKWILITLSSVLAIIVLSAVLFFTGLPIKSEDVIENRKIITETNGNKEWLIHFETKDGKPLTAKTEYKVSNESGEKSQVNRVVITLKSPPLGNKSENGFTWGYSVENGFAQNDNFDYTVEIKYKDTTVSYSMKKEGLFNK